MSPDLGEAAEITVTMPLDAWRSFPDGRKLLAELQRQAVEQADGRGRTMNGKHQVATDKESGNYVATFGLKAAS